MTKKRLITFIAIAVIAVTALFLLVLNRTKKTFDGQQEEQSSAVESMPAGTNQFLRDLSSEISKTNADDNPENMSDNSITINDIKDTAGIEKAYVEYLKKKPNSKLEWTDVLTGADKVVPLDDFAKGVDLNINPQFKELLAPFRYYLISCNFEGKISRGLMLQVKVFTDYKGDLDKDEKEFLKNWESTMLRDTHRIIFPNINFAEDQLKQRLEFERGKYNFARINLPSGEIKSLNYAMLFDYFIISDSLNCMDKMADQLISPAS